VLQDCVELRAFKEALARVVFLQHRHERHRGQLAASKGQPKCTSHNRKFAINGGALRLLLDEPMALVGFEICRRERSDAIIGAEVGKQVIFYALRSPIGRFPTVDRLVIDDSL